MTTTYKDAGVDIEAGNEFIKRILPLVKSTYKPEVLSGVGGFAAHTALNLQEIDNPVLVSATDGVGTKLLIAKQLNKFDTIGIDLVAMCVNDLLCSGAKPLLFLDYFATDKLKPEKHTELIKGITDGCKQADCSLVGGETAELPGLYNKDDFDLAGFAVGIVDRNKIIDGSNISIGNTIIGISSSGIHSNGYSLARKICSKYNLNDMFEKTGKTLGEILLEPTKIYSKLIHNLLADFRISGIAHITGGGLIENIPRILPKTCQANISMSSWERPAIFDFLQKSGNVQEKEMQRVFNLGIGLVLIVPSEESVDICERIRSFGEGANVIGEIVKIAEDEPRIILE